MKFFKKLIQAVFKKRKIKMSYLILIWIYNKMKKIKKITKIIILISKKENSQFQLKTIHNKKGQVFTKN